MHININQPTRERVDKMLRAIEDWELKYYKLTTYKRFKFFKWEISFNFQILNSGLHKEWEKRVQKIIDNSVTTSSEINENCYTWTSVK